jgi:zinc transporter ZupT
MSGELINSAQAVLATLIPLYGGIFIPFLIAGKSKFRLTVLMAAASGIMFWSFLDLMNDAALLDAAQGFAGGLEQILLVGSFAAALLILFGLDQAANPTRRGKGRVISLSYATALLVALGIGFHSLGEGVEIGSLIVYLYTIAPTSSSLITAIGGLGSGTAYVFHKFLEGFVIGVFATALKTSFARSLLLGLVAGIPTIIGLAVALTMPIDATIFFAVGAAAVLYIEYKLIPNLTRRDSIMLYVVVFLLGFYLMYLAGLFHSYTAIF